MTHQHPVDEWILTALGAAARDVGLPTDLTLMLAQDETMAVEFTRAVRSGTADHFLPNVDWTSLRLETLQT